MLNFLDDLETASGQAKSLYVPPDQSLTQIESLLREVLEVSDTPSSLPKLAAGSKTGAIIFWGSVRKCLVSPPFPVTEKYTTQGYDVEPVRSLLQRDFTLALVLVRLGSYAIGICEGEKLIDSKVGTGLVHARHKKGGSSQHRFERHREKQIEQFLNRVCGHARERLEARSKSVDYVIYGGAWTTISSLQKRCPFLNQFDDRTLPPLLAIPDPRKAVLEIAIGQAWSSNVTEWHSEGPYAEA